MRLNHERRSLRLHLRTTDWRGRCRWHAAWLCCLLTATSHADGDGVAEYLAQVQAVIRTLDDGLQEALDRYQSAAASVVENAEFDEAQRKANYRADFGHRQVLYREQAWVYGHAARTLAAVRPPDVALLLHTKVIAAFEHHEEYYGNISLHMDGVADEQRSYFSRETTVPDGEELTQALLVPLQDLERLGAEKGARISLLPAPNFAPAGVEPLRAAPVSQDRTSGEPD